MNVQDAASAHWLQTPGAVYGQRPQAALDDVTERLKRLDASGRADYDPVLAKKRLEMIEMQAALAEQVANDAREQQRVATMRLVEQKEDERKAKVARELQQANEEIMRSRIAKRMELERSLSEIRASIEGSKEFLRLAPARASDLSKANHVILADWGRVLLEKHKAEQAGFTDEELRDPEQMKLYKGIMDATKHMYEGGGWGQMVKEMREESGATARTEDILRQRATNDRLKSELRVEVAKATDAIPRLEADAKRIEADLAAVDKYRLDEIKSATDGIVMDTENARVTMAKFLRDTSDRLDLQPMTETEIKNRDPLVNPPWLEANVTDYRFKRSATALKTRWDSEWASMVERKKREEGWWDNTPNLGPAVLYDHMFTTSQNPRDMAPGFTLKESEAFKAMQQEWRSFILGHAARLREWNAINSEASEKLRAFELESNVGIARIVSDINRRWMYTRSV